MWGVKLSITGVLGQDSRNCGDFEPFIGFKRPISAQFCRLRERRPSGMVGLGAKASQFELTLVARGILYASFSSPLFVGPPFCVGVPDSEMLLPQTCDEAKVGANVEGCERNVLF